MAQFWRRSILVAKPWLGLRGKAASSIAGAVDAVDEGASAKIHEGRLQGLSLGADINSESDLQSLCAAGGLGELIDVLEKSTVSASKKLYAQVMLKCGKTRSLSEAKRLHSHLARKGLELDSHVGSGIVEMYVKCGSLVDAQHMHKRLPERNEFCWTALISGCASCGQNRQALMMYEEMQEEGVKPSTFTFVQALKVCASLGDLETGKAIHARLIETGNDSDVFVGTALVAMYAKCGSMADAQLVFDKLPRRNVVSWNVMILGFSQKEEGELGLQLYARMHQEGVAPDDRTFVAVLKACSSLTALEGSTQVGRKFVKVQCLEKGRSIHAEVVERGFESDLFVGTTLVGMYAKCGSMMDAQHVFDKLPHRNVVTWTTMILGYAEMQEGGTALQLYAGMQSEGVAPDDRTFVGALKACSSLASQEEEKEVDGMSVKTGCLEKGRAIHFQLVKAGFEFDMFLGTMLVDMYVKCGSMVDARHVFDRLPNRDVASWNVMILGYAEQTESEEAFKLYAQLLEQGLSATGPTYVSVLKACGNSAALETGTEIHAQVCKAGVAAGGLLVATALVDMYAKCGSMVGAQQVFDALSTRDIVTWNALITGYARHGESDRVFHLFDRMRQEGIQPNEITFLSVLTVCSHAGLVNKGQAFFDAMSRHFGIFPDIGHYNCMVDLLGRAGQLDKVLTIVEKMPFQPDSVIWTTVLGACQKWTNVKVGRHAFEQALRVDEKQSAPYVLMANIYADAQMWEEHDNIQALRENARAWKKPGRSWWTEIGGLVHTFVVRDKDHPQSKDIYEKLRSLFLSTKKET